jgi:hypothetical protein
MNEKRRQGMKVKKLLGILFAGIMVTSLLSGCNLEEEQAKPNKSIPMMKPLSGNQISFDHQIGNSTITTSYDLGNYRLENWRITDSKAINMKVAVKKEQQGTEILVEHVHADVSIKASAAQLNGLTQDSMDNSYHGTSQDGFFINYKYNYSNIFAVEGFSKDIISGWTFYCGDYGTGEVTSQRLTEGNLLAHGTYGSQLSVVYNFLVKNPGEDKYHVESVVDELIIPTDSSIKQAQEKAKKAKEEKQKKDQK